MVIVAVCEFWAHLGPHMRSAVPRAQCHGMAARPIFKMCMNLIGSLVAQDDVSCRIISLAVVFTRKSRTVIIHVPVELALGINILYLHLVRP